MYVCEFSGFRFLAFVDFRLRGFEFAFVRCFSFVSCSVCLGTTSLVFIIV